MKVSLLSLTTIVSLTTGAMVPRQENKGPCECPSSGPDVKCMIKPAPLLPHNAPQSAFCGPANSAFSYGCEGTYDQPNCNACAQSVLGNTPKAGRMKQCAGAKFCSNDKGVNFHICAKGEQPFVPTYNTEISYSDTQNSGTSIVSNGNNQWLVDQLPDMFKSICHDTACDPRPPKTPSRSLMFISPGGAPVEGTLELTVSSSQFETPEEREYLINAAALAILRATTCEDKNWRNKCSAKNLDCDLDPKKLTVCTGPRDINIAMRAYDETGKNSLHSFLHFQLKWQDNLKPFDCSVLEAPASLLEKVDLSGRGKVITENANMMVTICEGIKKIVDLASSK